MAIVISSIKAADNVLLFFFGKSVPVTITKTHVDTQNGRHYTVGYQGQVNGLRFSGSKLVTKAEFDDYTQGQQASAMVRNSTHNHCLGGRMAVLKKTLESLGEVTRYVVLALALLLLILPLFLFWIFVVPDHIKHRKRRS